MEGDFHAFKLYEVSNMYYVCVCVYMFICVCVFLVFHFLFVCFCCFSKSESIMSLKANQDLYDILSVSIDHWSNVLNHIDNMRRDSVSSIIIIITTLNHSI